MVQNKLPIILIGFMGSGKSTIAQYYALKQNATFIDLDHYIEDKEKMTIPEIFDQYGEQYFRSLEYKYIQECIDKADIIATGGGIVENDEAFKFLKQQANVIWLDCHLEIVYDRISNDPHRPNANNRTLEQLNYLYSSRVIRYNEIAFMKLNSDELTISEIYDKLIRFISCE